MGKGRAPCCDKSKVKRGPWSSQEDLTLITFIQKHGHHNWRSLPKLAGLKRCGKSCRLRWINYLRPDVKRGNLSKEEEDAIIHYHNTLGNKWSKIASFLPGRTDNEIKNVWNTHLKKRLKTSSSFSSSSSSISSIHEPSTKSEVNHESQDDSGDSSYPQGEGMNTKTEIDELREIQLLLDHDDYADINSYVLETNDMLFQLDSLIHPYQTHVSTREGETQEVTKEQSFDHPPLDIPFDFEDKNGECDLWMQLVESTSPALSPSYNNEDEFNKFFNYIDNDE